jgi:protein TonB
MALTETGTMVTGDRRLWLAIGVSLLLHGVLLSLHFTFPEASRALQGKVLDIVLVNARSERKPTDAQVRAQVNLDRGGNSEEDRRASTPLPPSPREQSGSDLEQEQKRRQALEAQQRKLLTQARKSRETQPEEARPQPEPAPRPSPEPPPLNGRDLANSALEMMRLEARIARQTDEYNKRPRVRSVGIRAEEYRYTQYEYSWRNKVERVGTLNYPLAARGRLSGSLILTLVVNKDGSVARVEIDRPSGHRVLDEAARRIINMAAPFAEFPAEILRECQCDQLSFTRTFIFTSSNQIEMEQSR